MLRPRIIPCLLIQNKGLVKTVKFKNPKYVGDPINAVRIFNEKEVDELIILDIDASVKNIEPDYVLIEKLAMECRMPLCYGGGIKNAKQAQKIFNLGVEKIAISSSVISDINIIKEIANEVGSQSVVVVVDVKKKLFGGYDIYIHNGKKKVKKDLNTFVKEIQEFGAGEIIFNSIDNDGLMMGYDLDLLKYVKPIINIPLTILGGAGSLEDIKNVIVNFGIIGVSAGSLFVFKGKYKAVLISYISKIDKEKIFENIQN